MQKKNATKLVREGSPSTPQAQKDLKKPAPQSKKMAAAPNSSAVKSKR